MRTTTDAIRSLKKYAYAVLGTEWELRLWGEEGKFELPFAYVARAGGATPSGSAYFGQMEAPYAVHCHPVPQDTVEASIIEAERVEQLLINGFRFQGVGLGRPMRVPLYDYAGQVAVEAPASGRLDRTGPDSDGYNDVHGDYMRITSFGVNLLPDPEDERRIAVVADIRLSWAVPGRLLSGPQAKSVLGINRTGTAT